MMRLQPNMERIIRDILTLSEFTSPREPGYTRISFSKEDRMAREYVASIMKREANLEVRVDSAGNLLGRRNGKQKNPAFLIGSHIDTVRGGGKFDGIAGVVAAIEMVRQFAENNIETLHPVEVVIFIAEEPSFGISTVGSRAMAGELTEALLGSLQDESGRTLGRAIEEMGGDPRKIGEAKRTRESISAYLELHIEQGLNLFKKNIPIGVVTGIAGIYRGKIKIIGRPDHAGTTSMADRRDALAAASECILGLERICRKADDVVGTTGRIDVFPNALNVVPGEVLLGVEVRSTGEPPADAAIAFYRSKLEEIAKERGVTIHCDFNMSSMPVTFDCEVSRLIEKACESLGIPFLALPSWAGHDAGHLGRIVPAGMIFVPSFEGKSHCPEEWTDFENIALGVEVLGNTVMSLDRRGSHE